MTELREELKPRPGEEPVEYVERVEAALEEHFRETGERLTEWGTMPGERPGETLERFKVLKEARAIREAEKERRRERAADTDADEQRRTNVSDVGNGYRTKSQERDIEKAVSGFEAAKKRLFRTDGSKVYGEEEHGERLGKLIEELREKVEAVAAEAQSDVIGYEREALALSYADPASMVPVSDRGRLETSRAFVKEDCEALAAPALTERLEAVSAGRDRVAKVLHARYGRMRLEAREAESGRLHREGRSTGADRAREDRALREAVAALEADIEDPKTAKKAAGLKEAAQESRRVAREAKSRLSQADGSDAAARERQRVASRAAF